MTLKKFSLFTVFALVMLITIVACNSEMNDQVTESEVSFVPTVTKSLNQDGSVANISQDVNDFFWKYVVINQNDNGNPVMKSDSLEWKTFQVYDETTKQYSDVESGLGVIRGLSRGQSYFFGLQGYTTYTNASNERELIWEGYHYDSSKHWASIPISSKRASVSIDVESVGNGYLYFNINAPLVLDAGVNYTTQTNDRFVYSYGKLNQTVAAENKDIVLEAEYDEEYDMFYYVSTEGTPERSIVAGDYLFTVKQQTWDVDDKVYVDVPGRKQVLIASIQSGIETIISGSLDSSAGDMTVDYYGNGDGKTTGFKLEWLVRSDALPTFFLTSVTNSTGIELTKAQTLRYNSSNQLEKAYYIGIPTDDYANINFLSSGTDYIGFFVNGDEILTKDNYKDVMGLGSDATLASVGTGVQEAANGFLYKTSGTNNYLLRYKDKDEGVGKEVAQTLIRLPDVATNKIDKLVVEGGDVGYMYILTVQYNKKGSATGEAESVSFTVEGGVVLITDIKLEPSILELKLDPQVVFTSTSDWENNVGALPTIEYFEVTEAGVTTGGTSVGPTLPNNTFGTTKYYYAVITAGSGDNKAEVRLPTETKANWTK